MKEELARHKDNHGVQYKQPYDKSLSQGDDNYGQENLIKYFEEELTYVPIFSAEELELIATAFKS